MKTKHTPGPWRIVARQHSTEIESLHQTVASDVSNCDAELIAAAPELLDALQFALSTLESMPPLLSAAGDRNEKAQAKARAAIAKATAP